MPNVFTVLVSASISGDSNVITDYKHGLLSYSSTFVRPHSNMSDYHYQAIAVDISKTGPYSFISSSQIDTYGCFYNYAVDPTDPYRSLVTFDNDSGGNQQFKISLGLESGKTYVLIVTTFAPNVTGFFTITAVGPASVDLRQNDLFILWLTTTTSESIEISIII